MDQNQKRYAMQRVKSVCDAKLEQLKKKHTITPKVLSDKEKLKLIYDAEVDVKRGGITLDTKLRDAFSFSRFKPEAALDKDAYNKAAVAIRELASAVEDLIMLGDGGRALVAINQFCKGY